MKATHDFQEAAYRAETNLRALELMSRYLNLFPSYIKEEDVVSLSRAAGMKVEDAFGALIAAACGLNGEENPQDRELEEKYFAGAIHCMDDSACDKDPYFQTVHMPKIKSGDWELGYKTISPYECFPSDDLRFLPHGIEVPQLGYFTKSFRTPVVRQGGREWMTITPSERNTMLRHVELARGKVAVFGLGLGYYPFMISNHEIVDTITIVERDASVIALFEKYVLPQFPHREKIRIVQQDAFLFAESMRGFDTAYVDIWHDVSDGAEMYLRMKKLEKHSPETCFLYWIEPSILAFLRSLMLFDFLDGRPNPLAAQATNTTELWAFLSNERIRAYADQIPLTLLKR